MALITHTWCEISFAVLVTCGCISNFLSRQHQVPTTLFSLPSMMSDQLQVETAQLTVYSGGSDGMGMHNVCSYHPR